MLAVAPKPIGPPILKSFSKTFEIALMINGNTFQNHSKAERLEITIIKGSIWKAKIIELPAPELSKGELEVLLK
jgi:hypothetical protein